MKRNALLALNLLWGVAVIAAFALGSIVAQFRMSRTGQDTPVAKTPGGEQVPNNNFRQGGAYSADDPALPDRVSPISSLPVPRAGQPMSVVISSSQDFAKLVETDLDDAKRVYASIKASPADPHGTTRQTYGAMIVSELLTRDLESAISFSDRESIWWNSSVEKLANEVGKQRGRESLLKWVDNIEYRGDDGGGIDYKTVAACAAIAVVAREDPGRARKWLIANSEQPYVDGYAFEQAAKNSYEEPGLQLEWLAELPADLSDKKEGIARVFARYVRRDLDAAAQWLSEQSLEPMHDRAIQELADAASAFDPEGARIWAEEISDEALRTEVLKRLLLLE